MSDPDTRDGAGSPTPAAPDDPASPRPPERPDSKTGSEAGPEHAPAEPSSFDTNRLIAVICHDLRSPLSSIVMGAGFLQKSLGALEGLASEKRILESILRSSDRLNTLIRDLHDVAHLESGRFEIEKHRLDVAAMVAAAITQHAPLGTKKSVKVEAGPLPVGASVECDRDRLLQAFGKLVDNAIRYSPPNGTVRVDVEILPGRASFSVADDGTGMSADRLAHAFDHRWHASQSPRDGTGLGLALVRGIANAHGGGAHVESTSGHGTRVSFWLPVAH